MILFLFIVLAGPGDVGVMYNLMDNLEDCRAAQVRFTAIAHERQDAIVRSECIIVGKQA